MAYAKLFSTITESSLWSASKDARLLFMSMLAKADSTGFVEAALPGLARLANLTLEETEKALAELMAPDPYSKSPDCDGARVGKAPRGWFLVNYEAYRDRRDDDQKREYQREYMRRYRQSGKVSQDRKDLLGEVSQAEAEASTEREGEREARTPPVNLQEGQGDQFAEFLTDHRCKIEKGGKCILDEWRLVVKGLRPKQVREILEQAKPGIMWPSEFKKHREARGV